MEGELWGELAVGVVVAAVSIGLTTVVNRWTVRRNRFVWVLEHVQADTWTVSYYGKRAAWDATFSLGLTSDPSEAFDTTFSPVRCDWVRGDRNMIHGLRHGRLLRLAWIDHDRCAASIQTRDGQARYELSAAEVKRSGPIRLAGY